MTRHVAKSESQAAEHTALQNTQRDSRIDADLLILLIIITTTNIIILLCLSSSVSSSSPKPSHTTCVAFPKIASKEPVPFKGLSTEGFAHQRPLRLFRVSVDVRCDREVGKEKRLLLVHWCPDDHPSVLFFFGCSCLQVNACIRSRVIASMEMRVPDTNPSPSIRHRSNGSRSLLHTLCGISSAE